VKAEREPPVSHLRRRGSLRATFSVARLLTILVVSLFVRFVMGENIRPVRVWGISKTPILDLKIEFFMIKNIKYYSYAVFMSLKVYRLILYFISSIILHSLTIILQTDLQFLVFLQ